MAARNSKYQYETSPRKLEPYYAPSKKQKKPQTTTKTKKNVKKSTNKSNKKKVKEQAKQKQVIKYVLIGFGIIFAITYRNSKIDESFNKVQKLKDELSNIEKENVQLEIGIENSLNLNNIEQQAKELLGMQKLTNKQTVYVSLPKEDYIEIAAEKVNIANNNGIIEKIIAFFK